MYSRVNWEDSPSTNTPINATNLNTMDKGIYENAQAIEDMKENVLIFENVTVSASEFVTYSASGSLESNIHDDYPYKADISLGGVTASYKADVVPSYAAIQLGVLCPLNKTAAGYVRIYANSALDEDVTLLTISCVKEAS